MIERDRVGISEAEVMIETAIGLSQKLKVAGLDFFGGIAPKFEY